ncbi:MAG: pilus assembly protein PilM [Candidatus Omnitrophica bacterium]|nr:pilus assembly protein PilM [Candidatus Omnitrophota bacterium]
MNKNKAQHNKNIVKEIFGRPHTAKGKVSALFTNFKRPPKTILSLKAKKSQSLTALPPAIDINSQSIKFLQLAENPKGELEIVAIDEEKYSIALEVNHLTYQKDALQKIVKRNNITQDCVIGLSVNDIRIYNVTFPSMPESELNTALQYKLAQIRPFDLNMEEINFKFLKLDTDEQKTAVSPGIRLLCACAPYKIIAQKSQLFNAVGLKLFSLEISQLSLINLSRFFRRPAETEEVALWLDLGVDESSLIIEKNGKALFLRQLNFNFEHLANTVSKSLNISIENAKEALKQHGLIYWSVDKKPSPFLENKSSEKTQSESAKIYYAIVSHLENLVVDIEHSFKYFSYQVSQSQVIKFDRLILSGKGATLKNLNSFLGLKLGVPVEVVNPFDLFGISETLTQKNKALIQHDSNFTVCAALAVSSKTDKSQCLNFISAESKKSSKIFREIFRKKRAVAVTVAISCLFMILVGFQVAKLALSKSKMNFLRMETEKAKITLNDRNLEQLDLAKIESEILDKKILLKEELKFLEDGARRPEEISNILFITSLLLPEDVWVTKLKYEEGKLNIIGSTQDINVVMQLVDALKAKDEFSGASFISSEKESKSEIYTFEVVAEIRR